MTARLGASYATADAGEVGAFVAGAYGIGVARCRLMQRGFNDTYLVEAEDGVRFVFRISGLRARGPADVENETAFLAYLDGAGVPVAAAVPTPDGALHTQVALADGVRATVLFRHAGGRRPGLDDAGDARAQGETLAAMHRAAAGFPGREAGRYRLDLAHLLERPLAAVLALGETKAETGEALEALAGRLAAAVRGRALTWVRCHGDCHGVNAAITTEGAQAGRAVFFDFDDGGYGYLAYDLAVHLWAQVSFGRQRQGVWRAFHAGYGAVGAADEAAVPAFVAIRHIWLMGEYASQTARWGSEAVSGAFVERELAFLLRWERERMGRMLVSWRSQP